MPKFPEQKSADCTNVLVAVQARSHGAKQGPAGLWVALEPHANFEVDVSVATNRVYASKSIANLAEN